MITATNLTKKYGPVTAVDGVSFGCEPGTITGFLGPDGAGKSTTLRTLLDASAMNSGRTGRATLHISATVTGVPAKRADDLLEQVDLGKAAGRRVGTYSLGMRQRLGLAHALLGNPRVLILDEPANGLDPEGIAWIRATLHDFAARGGTVLLSSHLLTEIQATATHLVIIAMTSEWSQRTALTTFTLEPGRTRVLAAKSAAGLILAVACGVFAAVVATVSVIAARDAGHHIAASWDWAELAGFVLFIVATSAIGIALGAALHSTPAAIVTYFALAAAFNLLMIPALAKAADWVNTGQTFGWMLAGQWSGHTAQIAVSAALWILLPLSIGDVS
jgi:ABC-2 type transport system ATP-binding protein